jgi:hypothetical protein
MNSAKVSRVITTSDGTFGDEMASSMCFTRSSCRKREKERS